MTTQNSLNVDVVHLSNQVSLLNATVEQLSSRIELVEAINKRQNELDRLAKRTGRLSIFQSIVLMVALVIGFNFYKQTEAETKSMCENQNEIRAAETKLWTDLINRNPIIKPGPNPTAVEIENYNSRVNSTNDFIISLEENFHQQEC